MALGRSFIFNYDLDVAEIHDEVLFAPGGDIYEWSHSLARELETVTKRTAPPGFSRSRWGHVGTGRLRAGVTGRAEVGRGKVVYVILNSSAPYTMYVHAGTTGPIYSNMGWLYRSTIDDILDGDHFDKREAPMKSMRGLYMALPPAVGAKVGSRIVGGSGGNWRYHMRVRGQAANPFLARGYNRVAELGHESLGPLQLDMDLAMDPRVEGEVGPVKLSRPEYRRQARLRKLRKEQERRARRRARRGG